MLEAEIEDSCSDRLHSLEQSDVDIIHEYEVTEKNSFQLISCSTEFIRCLRIVLSIEMTHMKLGF